ncbi:MAG: dihydroneopterin aldolase [Magnetococcales bacterium]|nr:dihydroneopterin aldolase [Magnetococcales bacterium]
MERSELDSIVIRDLLVRCVIGLQEWERNTLQDVLINLTLFTDTRAAGESDRIEDAVDYKALTKQIIAFTGQSAFFLVEALAERIARICLEHPRVLKVRVEVEKPGALRFARSAGVRIQRQRPEP